MSYVRNRKFFLFTKEKHPFLPFFTKERKIVELKDCLNLMNS